IQIQQGSNIRITGNTIEGARNAAIMLTQDRGRTSDVTISDNWLNGGKCTVNLSEKGRGPFRGISIVDNTFGRVV
ncbi:right-handed parallel beta-helix repeat-containing protein, partial [Georgenia sp. 10Sc9-8]|nr:right-handed parallel beta-helix repeat-containing protein [Georgenia halotolerans]